MTEEEITKALCTKKNNSVSGIDGITTSFPKFCFWNKVKDLVIDSLKAAHAVGQMSPLQRKAVITLIHKGKDLQRDDLNNWRPITLTNTDYKILAECLSRRLLNVIGDSINEDQVGFIKGRNVSTLIRLIDDTIDFLYK